MTPKEADLKALKIAKGEFGFGTWTVRRDPYGRPTAIELLGYDIVHLYPSERTECCIEEIVRRLNEGEK